MTSRKQLRWVFDAVMRARGYSRDQAEETWARRMAQVEEFRRMGDQEALADLEAEFRADWLLMRCGWRPRVPTTREEVQRMFDADRVIRRG